MNSITIINNKLYEIIEKKAESDPQYAIAAAIINLGQRMDENLRVIGWGTLSPTQEPGCLEKIAMVLGDVSESFGSIARHLDRIAEAMETEASED